MVRRHGWAGSPPADGDEARLRIVRAATQVVDRGAPSTFTLSDVATELGITRQTVYRYFSSTDELLLAVGRVANESFIDDLAQHLEAVTEPSEWVVEAVASAIEWLPNRPHLMLLFAAGRSELFARTFTAGVSVGTGRDLFKRSGVDWVTVGYSDRELDELTELMLRTVQSMVIDPPEPPRSARELRAYLRRWIAPAVVAGAPTP